MKIEADRIEAGTFHGMPVTVFLQAIDAALLKGERVEISPGNNSGIKIRTVHRKDLKVNNVPTP